MREKVDEARKLNPHIVWIEKTVSKPEAIQLYSNAQVFCCPSVYEPFGIIKSLKAMACRAAVVASSTGGIREVVVDGETGYRVPAATPSPGFPTHPDQFARDLGTKVSEVISRSPEVPPVWGRRTEACGRNL